MGQSGSEGLSGDQSVVPVHEEPCHRLVHEAPGLRLLDVCIPARETSLFHSHVEPTLYVTLEDALIATQRPGGAWEHRSGLRSLGDVTDRCDYYADPLVHRVRNPGPGVFHLLGILNVDAGEHGLVAMEGAELVTPWFVVRRLAAGDATGTAATTRVFVRPGSGTWQVVAAGAEAPPPADGMTLEIQVGQMSGTPV